MTMGQLKRSMIDRTVRFMGSLRECKSVDIPDFGSLEDVVDAMEICDEHDVPYDGLDDLDEFKERLQMHFTKISQQESRKTEIEKSMLQAGQDDCNKRHKLISFMKEMLEILRKQGPDMTLRRDSMFLDELLKTEGTSSDLEHDCHVRTQNLEHGECLVIVAGETSAGKSSVLNLLFEDDILPVHNNSSTSVITLVRYHKRKHARVVYKTGEPDKVFDLDKKGVEELSAIAFMKSASEREFHNVKEVHVYLPLPLLQSGLVLVDSPGIGENEFLENELINFIDRHQVLGFIYIIKTDNAGGVQEDRLLNLLRIVIQSEKSKGKSTGRRFDPRAALFVCNRFDLINKAEIDTIKRNALDKLASCWPSFDESQVVFFSTGRARRDVQADIDYINDNYRELLESLRYMFVTALEKRIKSSYKWMENILKRTTHHLKTMVRRLDSSDIELEEKCENVSEKLTGLRHKSDEVMQELTDELENKSKDLYKVVRDFAESPYCKIKMTTGWENEEIPRVDNGLGDWPWIKGKIVDKFYDRLMSLVEDWDRDEGNINRMEEDIACRVKLDLNLLEIELDEIERELQSDSSSDSSDRPYSLASSHRRQSSLGYTPTKTKLFLPEPKLPMKLGGRMIKPISGIITAIKNSKKVGEYKKNPLKVVYECVKDIYDELLKESETSESETSESVLVGFVDFLLDRPRDYIAAIERKVPDMILSNQLMLNRFQESLETERKHLKEYEEMMTQTEALRRSLSEYGEGYIFVEDFARNELRILRTDHDGDPISVPFNVTDFLRGSSSDLEMSRRRDMRGLWTVLYGGQLFRNGVERGVTIRVYLPSSRVEFTYKEVAKLRCLSWQYTHIAEFLGIHNARTQNPSIVYDGGLRSVRKMLGSFCSRRDCVPLILEGTAAGLEYLHRKGLVHMELTQDTVTVDEYATAQLTGACLPRKASLPEEVESTDIGNFVYLAPEVLHGDTYDSCADIYSFGLFVLELATVEAAAVFRTQRQMTFCDFVKEVDPENMMDLDNVINVFTVKTRALIQSCLQLNKADRPGASEVAEYATYIKSEDEALLRLPNRRSRGIVKRPSLSVSTKL